MEIETKGLVFDIHRGTTHDGPGMRTTVFMKGCPLRCGWCHNPESICAEPELLWTQRLCIGCGSCVAACPNGAVSLGAGGVGIDRERCANCFACAGACPSGALEVAGKWWDAASLAKEARKDSMFFDTFEGGVTVSGGEPLMQYPFVAELLRQLKAEGESTALDTCGMAPRKALEAVYPYTDIFLYDVKFIDREAHEKHTGADNQSILRNLLWLAQKSKDDPAKRLWIRTPLIPGATATAENIAQIGKFFKGELMRKVERWELCAFNNVCRDKYAKMGREWEYGGASLMGDDEVAALLAVAQKYVGEVAVSTGLTAAGSSDNR